ncbi:FGGY family carbohydrate kinase [Knoellia sp. p5-6-4]|uniref:FGGY family carbohydrate kinase n=1 Tax=unclassified Knoellia TaxID=2618719 RepID=UPI0023DBA8B7|nr:FGGY family carbohydrate kinase [Knoellia sp. p5-6-4]MDF2145207.1 FGGY family carbohydrate kinase [Knoellia sp. p5-6-4]
MSTTLVAGVDSSTQSTKVVVCDADTGEVLRTGRAPHPEGTQTHPDRWWDAYRSATADGLLDGVSAIAVGGQQHGMCALDEHGAVVRDALLWNDTRSAGAAAELVAELGGPTAWVEAVGLVPVASFTITKLRWLAEHEPVNATRVHDVVLPHDWLTGQIVKQGSGFRGWTTDRGDASGTGYWSPITGEYRPDLLERAFGRVVGTPRVAEPAEAVGETDSGMLVAAGTGDNMAAALGLGILPGDVVVSLGTSGAVFGEHSTPVFDTGGDVASFASAAGDHLPLMCTLNAARVLTAAAQLIGTDLAGLDTLALAAAPGAGGLTLLPYLDGERTPNLPDATGTLGGLTRANATPENLARAAVEGMLCNLVAGVGSLTRLGVRAERVLLIGGASASAAVRALAPMLFGVPVVVPSPGEYVAVGAARQAAWALRGGDTPPRWEVGTETELEPHPGPEGSEITGRYAGLLRTVHGR